MHATIFPYRWKYVSVGSVLNLHETSVSSIRALISRVSSEKTHVDGIETAVAGVLLLAFNIECGTIQRILVKEYVTFFLNVLFRFWMFHAYLFNKNTQLFIDSLLLIINNSNKAAINISTCIILTYQKHL